MINAAITSTWTHHHLIYLNQRILRYDPDMILFMDGFNDFFKSEPDHDQFATYSYGMPSRVIMGEPTLYSLAYANASQPLAARRAALRALDLARAENDESLVGVLEGQLSDVPPARRSVSALLAPRPSKSPSATSLPR